MIVSKLIQNSTMKEGNIVLGAITQEDGEIKKRPILILRELPNYDFFVCGISTQLHQRINGFDEIILPDFQNRLKQESVIRLTFLSSISERRIEGTIGNISQNLLQKLLQRLSDYLIE
jgi:mRNA interferase MazF